MYMQFSDDQIEELRLICEEDFGEPVTPLEARQMAMTLCDLHQWFFDLISSGKVDHLKPVPSEDETLTDSV